MSDLVGNPEDRFSHNETHLLSNGLLGTCADNFQVSVACLVRKLIFALWCTSSQKLWPICLRKSSQHII